MDTILEKLTNHKDTFFNAHLITKLIELKEFDNALDVIENTKIKLFKIQTANNFNLDIVLSILDTNNEQFILKILKTYSTITLAKYFFLGMDKLCHIIESQKDNTINALNQLGVFSLMGEMSSRTYNHEEINKLILKSFLYATENTLDLIVKAFPCAQKTDLKMMKLSLIRNEEKYFHSLDKVFFTKELSYHHIIYKEIDPSKKKMILEMVADTSIFSILMSHNKTIYPLTMLLLEGHEKGVNLIVNQLSQNEKQEQLQLTKEIFNFIEKTCVTTQPQLIEKGKVLLEKMFLEEKLPPPNEINNQSKWKI